MAVSIVDYLKKQGKDSSYAARKQLAAQNGIQDYRGTAAQNMNLLSMLEEKPSDEGEFLTSYVTDYRRVQDHGQ